MSDLDMAREAYKEAWKRWWDASQVAVWDFSPEASLELCEAKVLLQLAEGRLSARLEELPR